MEESIECFVIEPTDLCRRWLRRYTLRDSDHCPVNFDWGHDAWVRIPDASKPGIEHNFFNHVPDDMTDLSYMWPTTCYCGYVFSDEADHEQIYHKRLYRVRDTTDSPLFTLDEAPVGSIYFADWLVPLRNEHDGHVVTVVTPGGVWCVDGPDQYGMKWDRTGDDPLFSVSNPFFAEGVLYTLNESRLWLTPVDVTRPPYTTMGRR